MGLLIDSIGMVRAVAVPALGVGLAAVGVGRAAVGSAAAVVGSVAGKAGSDAISAGRSGARILVEATGVPAVRRISSAESRHWIEVKGLAGGGESLGAAVLDELRGMPGVESAVINGPTARVVVTTTGGGPSGRTLADAVARAEKRNPGDHADDHAPMSTSLPGDDVLLSSRLAAATVSAAGLGLSLFGYLLPLPGMPALLSVPVVLADHHPRLRGLLESRLGVEGAEFALAGLNAASAALAGSPATMMSGTLTRSLLFAETLDGRRCWRRREQRLADLAAGSGDLFTARHGKQGSHERTGSRYASTSMNLGAAAAALFGVTADSPTAAAGVEVAAPRSIRTVREAFACAVGRNLHRRHDALVVHPLALRWLADIDTVVVDPRILYTDQLTVSRVRGLNNSHRAAAWSSATAALRAGRLAAGWHPMSSIPGDHPGVGEALVSPVRDPLASALVTEARNAGARVISLDDDGLHSLRQGFDELRPATASVEDDLAAIVAELREAGSTVLLLVRSGDRAALEADVTVGVTAGDQPPVWGADVLVGDLAAAWRVLRTVPAAVAAGRRGVAMSAGSSLLGAVMLIPGVPGSGPASVDLTAALGLWSGYSLGRKVFGEVLPQPEPDREWHALSTEDVMTALPQPAPQSGREAGDTRRLAESAAVGRIRSALDFVRDYLAAMREDLSDPITPILATGAAASALLGSPLDAAMVASVLAVNFAISAQQSVHAEHLLRGLLAVQEPPARRVVGAADAGETEEVPSAALRPGDLIDIRAGEVIPADARLFAADGVEVDESVLTGESLPMAKNTDATPGAPLGERTGMVFAGTTLVAGHAVGVVTAVGAGSAVRRALAMAPAKSGEIGLAAQLRRITGKALPWSLAGGGLVGLLSLLRGTPIREAASGTVSIGVAAVPEGLPLVVTLAQSASARRLAGSAVLIRNPRAIEAFARLDVVCFDKTGTLSENRLRVTTVRPLAGGAEDDVLAAALATTAADADGRIRHATDEAIRRAAADAGVAAPKVEAFLPFQSSRPLAAALIGDRLVVKGAPERLAAAVMGDASRRAEQTAGLTAMAAQGLRVLAVADRRLSAAEVAGVTADPQKIADLCDSSLTLRGLIGLADTARPGARELLEQLQARGLGVKLITGDHPLTAAVIASGLGVPVTVDEVLSGDEWEALTAAERKDAVGRYAVFARMSPEHKVQVVQTLEGAGQVTAMVGDGANDAAAIRAASVGVGLVFGGSDPARMAADVMLLDARIGALLDALDESEQLWRRVHSAVSMLLGHNVGEVSFGLITSALTGRPALSARQMLLVNMLTDALPAAALAVSPQRDNGTSVGHDEAAIWRAVAERGVFTTLGGTLAWAMAVPTGTPARASTVGLIGLVVSQMMQTLSDSHGPLVVATNVGTVSTMAAIISTPGISQLFGCTPLGPFGWGQGICGAMMAGAIAKALPGLLGRLADRLGDSLLDDEDSQPEQDGVEVFDGRGQQTGARFEQGIGV